MPTALQYRLARQRVAARAPRAGSPFHEVASIPGAVPLDAWGGWDGNGWGPMGSLWLTTGVREGGRQSQVYRLDSPTGSWVDDGCPSGAETLNKIRNGHSRADNLDYLTAFFESPNSGQRFLVARRADTGWNFVNVPATSRSYPDPVGGRGLAFERGGPPGGRVFAGASYQWRDDQVGRLLEQSGGDWNQAREHHPALLWELEFDAEGRLWEFWNSYGGSVPHCYVNGVEKTNPHGGNISSANWFPVSGHMYVIGGLEASGDSRDIARSTNGDEWERVHTFSSAQIASHVLYVPRGNGELWAAAQRPFQVAYSTDGSSWTEESTIPAFETGQDTNHLCAVAYWKNSIWVMGRDAGQGSTRIFTDFTGATGDGGGGGSGTFTPRPFPTLVIPPRPPDLPTVPPPQMGQPGQNFLHNDALAAAWVEDFERVVKDAWRELATVVDALQADLAAVKTRVAKLEH
jgi:hypothetical protein